MSKRVKIEGQRFGHLIVDEYVGNQMYRCFCDCGKVTFADGRNLRRGHTTSCGCAKENDLTGRRFGQLTVMHRLPTSNKRVFWLCRCDCGTFCSARHDVLMSGGKTSCGCAYIDKDIPAKMRAEFVGGTQLSKIKSTPTKANKSGIVGVNYYKNTGGWQAGIRFRGHRYNLGVYKSKEQAAAVRRAAEEAIFGDFLEWYNSYQHREESEDED